MTVSHRCAGCGRQSGAEELRRDLYLAQRTIGDYQALKRGRLGRRIVRRTVTRRIMRSLWS